MSFNISERRLSQQYENYTIDTDRLRQRMRDKDNSSKPANYDTVDISADGRSALENRLFESISAGHGIEVSGKLVGINSFSIFEDYEKAVSAEKRDKVVSGNFDRHLDKMVSVYQQMKRDIEEKYADMGGEQLYYAADDKGIQKLTREKELELLDQAYEQHSRLMAGFTESLSDLQDFKPQIVYHQLKSNVKEQAAPADGVKKKKGEIREQAYQAFMSAINKGGSEASRSELNRIWDYYA